MAERLAGLGLIPDYVLCSDSRRTLETWDLLSEAWRDATPSPHLDVRPELYHASPRAIVSVVRSAPEAASTVMVVAHNPGLHDVAQLLVRGDETRKFRRLVRKFPTAAVAVIECEVESWARLDRSENHLARFIRPKDLEG